MSDLSTPSADYVPDCCSYKKGERCGLQAEASKRVGQIQGERSIPTQDVLACWIFASPTAAMVETSRALKSCSSHPRDTESGRGVGRRSSFSHPLFFIFYLRPPFFFINFSICRQNMKQRSSTAFPASTPRRRFPTGSRGSFMTVMMVKLWLDWSGMSS